MIDMPVMEVCAWKNRQTAYRPTVLADSKRVPTKFIVGATSSYQMSRFSAYNRKGIQMQGFRDERPETAPETPAVMTTAVITQQTEHTADVSHVDGAG
jgi:hypothetical protein